MPARSSPIRILSARPDGAAATAAQRRKSSAKCCCQHCAGDAGRLLKSLGRAKMRVTARSRRKTMRATGPGELAEARAAAGACGKNRSFGLSRPSTRSQALDAQIADCLRSREIAVDTETTSLDPMTGGTRRHFACRCAGPRLLYPRRPSQRRQGRSFGGGDLLPGQLPADKVLAAFEAAPRIRSVLKIAHNMKFDWLVFRQHGITLRPIEDTLLISYVLDAGLHRSRHGCAGEKHFEP